MYIEFKPLVQVDPSVLTTNRAVPVKNPRPGDYMLSKTASTEGIASKKSLELKKRYLLGGDTTGSSGLMKSDSTSVLDSKFRNFHSNISECQKLLNPTAPTQQSPLAKSETTIGVPAIVSTNNTVIKLSSKEFDSMKNSDEKENVYGKFVQTKNKLNATTSVSINENNVPNQDEQQLEQQSSPTKIILDLTAVKDDGQSKVLTPDNKTKELTNIIDLVTPSPLPIYISDSSEKIVETVPNRQISSNKELYRKLNYDDGNNASIEHQNVIDLTVESPIKDQESTSDLQTTNERNKTAIDSMLKRGNNNNVEMRKTKSFDDEIIQPPQSPLHETCIQVPQIPWKTRSKAATDVESDSLSSSTTSSVDDIPHYILDSTTSPDTMPANNERFAPPRLEIRDTSGELMQIDSLMIIDGKYIGDPDDLQYMQMPSVDKNENVDKVVAKESKVTFNMPTNTLVATTSTTATTTTTTSSVDVVTKPKPLYRYESMRNKELRFDSRNENKIDTLKNIPLILPKSYISSSSTSSDRPLIGIQKSATVIAIDKPTILPLNKDSSKSIEDELDVDKTPTAATASEFTTMSDSETEITGPVLTETELSDWNADDAVSENFVDIEFVLNSNKGTIRRNKKSRKKHQQQHNSNMLLLEQLAKKNVVAPLAKDLDFDGIEFMDTGSEDSYIETYSATNKALLKNCGYVQFVDTTTATAIGTNNSKSLLSYKSDAGYGSSPKDLSEPQCPIKPTTLDLHEAVNVEVSGIDYIEQGACILSDNVVNDFDNMKTPMNEVSPMFNVKQGYNSIGVNQQPDSLHDMEEDSLLMIASQGTTTTEDSDALTIVTSPVDSTSPPKLSETPVNTPTTSNKNICSNSLTNNVVASTTTTAVAATATTTSGTETFSIDMPSLKNTTKQSTQSSSSLNRSEVIPTTTDDTYSEYVRKLQMKITKISNARDSIDVRKIKRKHSKCDLSCCNNSIVSSMNTTPPATSSITTVVAATTAIPDQQQLTQMSVIDNNSSSNMPLSIYLNNDMPATVNERIEEITKERTKQKDLIHDLVMDKLQSKKQLNAEKRLNRSRNRNMGMFSPPPPTSQQHSIQKNSGFYDTPSSMSTANIAVHKTPLSELSPNYFTPKSKNVTPSLYDKTESSTMKYKDARNSPSKFTRQTTGAESSMSRYGQDINGFVTPQQSSSTTAAAVTLLHTDLLRTEARAKARLKSNQDLGLSPDEKMLLLRKRFHHLNTNTPKTTPAHHPHINNNDSNISDDMKLRERKMMSSKSVNDIAATSFVNDDTNDRASIKKHSNFSDFTSDPNLAEINNENCTQKRRHNNKDPERRRSIIKAVSDFFYKKKSDKDALASSPAKEKSPSGSNDGMFGRFRISPKSKSKDKDESAIITTTERSKSENCLKIDNALLLNSLSNDNGNEIVPPPIPPLPLNYQRSDDESCSANESRDNRKMRAHSKASRQAELKRLRIAQEIQREQEEIEVKLKDLEARGVVIEKALRGEGQNLEDLNISPGVNDENLLKELLEIWRNITQLKKRDDELNIRQQELKLEHRHAQLKEQLNTRLSCSKLDKSSSDVAAEGAILNEMLEIVAKRATLRPTDSLSQQQQQHCSSSIDAIESDI